MSASPQALATPESVPRQRCITTMTIPRIDVSTKVRTYEGSPDDAKGTRIQDRGILASPVGANGGVAAGRQGNFHVNGHRNSAGGVLQDLRKLRRGDLVQVDEMCEQARDMTYTYRIESRASYIDFFTPAGRAAQIAETPMSPGVPATRGYISISTCATQEDHARGDYRKDAFHNPPGRWVSIGVRVGITIHRA